MKTKQIFSFIISIVMILPLISFNGNFLKADATQTRIQNFKATPHN